QAKARSIPQGAGSEPADVTPPSSAPVQPIPFSHKAHASFGLKCGNCHAVSKGGEPMQIPNVKECFVCHESIKKESPAIEKLAQFQKARQTISWVRLYDLPEFVLFNHQKHLDASVACQVCHGAVENQDLLRQEKDISMVSCVNCHKLHKSPVFCGECHNIGY
ncbi:MAG TPA: cytochrome c3 family protein, partial [Candidatus Dormibacteraeota bacterium]|nr:cytochrome c3 family protein [Candidatus Dormibacteraeota bacterium]